MKKSYLIFIILSLMLMLASCMPPPVQGNTLTLYVEYETSAESFEFGKHISVSTDNSFTQLIKMLRGLPDYELNRYVYTFEWNEPVDTIYIKPPVLYIPTEIETVTLPITAGSIAMSSDGKQWFEITEVSVSDSAIGIYNVLLTIAPLSEDLPRSPEIIVGEQSFAAGTTEYNFNENSVFDGGMFSFNIIAFDDDADEAAAILENATLNFSNALLKAYPDSMVVTSDIESLEIIIVD